MAELLGRPPMGEFDVVVRAPGGAPAVLRNRPLLPDGTPMPTLYWLCDPALRSAIGTLESDGGVKRAESAIAPDVIAALHAAHAVERDAALPAGHAGPVPTGGVGGTRQGVKCLHAHYAHWLVGGDDAVGEWVHAELIAHELLPSTAPARIEP